MSVEKGFFWLKISLNVTIIVAIVDVVVFVVVRSIFFYVTCEIILVFDFYFMDT